MKKSPLSLSILSIVAVIGSMSLSFGPAFAEIDKKAKEELAAKLGSFPTLDYQLKFLSEVKEKSNGSIKGINWRPGGVHFRLSPEGVRIEEIVDSVEQLFSQETRFIGIVVDASVSGVSGFLNSKWSKLVRYNGNRAYVRLGETEFFDFKRRASDARIEIVCLEFFAPLLIDKTAFRILSSNGRYSLNDLILAEELWRPRFEGAGMNSTIVVILDNMSPTDRDRLSRLYTLEEAFSERGGKTRYRISSRSEGVGFETTIPPIKWSVFYVNYNNKMWAYSDDQADVFFNFNMPLSEEDHLYFRHKLDNLGVPYDYTLSGFRGRGWTQNQARDFGRIFEDELIIKMFDGDPQSGLSVIGVGKDVTLSQAAMDKIKAAPHGDLRAVVREVIKEVRKKR